MPCRPRGRTYALRFALFAVVAFPTTRAWAACPADSASLDATLDKVSTAFARMDVEGFYASRDEARASLPCLDAALAPALAGAYHRMEGLNAFLGRDTPGAIASFRAAVAADPTTELPHGLAIEGNPLYEAWQEAVAAPPSATEPARVKEGDLVVDGTPSDVVPVERPVVVQVVGDGVRTAYVADRDSFPAWLQVGVPETVVVPIPAPVPVPEPAPRKRATLPLAIAAGTTAVLAGGLLAGGLVESAKFKDPSTPYEDLEGHRAAANGLGYAAQISVGVAIVLGGFAVYEGVR